MQAVLSYGMVYSAGLPSPPMAETLLPIPKPASSKSLAVDGRVPRGGKEDGKMRRSDASNALRSFAARKKVFRRMQLIQCVLVELLLVKKKEKHEIMMKEAAERSHLSFVLGIGTQKRKGNSISSMKSRGAVAWCA